MTKQKIALFFGSGIIANAILNKAIPHIIRLGYEPILFYTGAPNCQKGSVPELQETEFYETVLLRDIVEPTSLNYKPYTYFGDKLIPNLFYTTKQIVQIYGLDYEYVKNVNDNDFIERLFSEESIVGAYSFRNYQIFHDDFIEAFEKKQNGFLWNMHTGLLPKYKGVYIPYHAIENNERVFGWSLHKVIRQIDAGEILASGYLPLDKTKSVLFTYLDMVDKGTLMFVNQLRKYKENSNIKGEKQSVFLRDSYFSFPSSQQMQTHQTNGVRFIKDNEALETYMRYYTLAGSEYAENLMPLIIEKIENFRSISASSEKSA